MENRGALRSWLGLCPDNRISGGQSAQSRYASVVNRAATSLRIAATTLLRSQTYLGAQYRRLRGKLGAPKAITAMAQPARPTGLSDAEVWSNSTSIKARSTTSNENRQQQIEFLRKKAAQLGLQVTAPHP